MLDTEIIKNRLDLVDLVKEHVQLTPAGTNWRGLCPFHREKSPSFFVSSEKGIWKCFGCGEAGDHFTFIEKIENLDFSETLQLLAKKAGVQLQERRPQEREQKDHLQQMYRLAAMYYAKVLADSSVAAAARDYLAKRGVAPETIRSFQLGYAPDSWDALANFLLKKGYAEKDVRSSGLVVERKDARGGYYDRFRDRIMFPIRSVHGDVIAFTSRTMKTDTQEGKYINSPTTPLYDKSRVLYCLDRSRHAIKAAGFAVMVEGQMDAISSHQAGVENVVAPSGTAATRDQIRLLHKYAGAIAFAFDQDAAGGLAIWKAMRLAHEQGISAYAVIFSGAKDPDELIQKDAGLWKKALASRRPALEVFLERLCQQHDLRDVQSKKIIAEKMIAEMRVLADPVEQDHYIQLVAKKIQIGQDALRTALARAGSGAVPTPAPAIATQHPGHDEQVEDLLLACLLSDPTLVRLLAQRVDPAVFTDPALKDLYKLLLLFYADQAKRDPHAILSFIRANRPELIARFQELQLFAEAWVGQIVGGDIQQAGREIARNLLRKYFSQQIATLRGDLTAYEAQGDTAKQAEALQQLQLVHKSLGDLATW